MFVILTGSNDGGAFAQTCDLGGVRTAVMGRRLSRRIFAAGAGEKLPMEAAPC